MNEEQRKNLEQLKKHRHDISTEKAKELHLEDWGTPEEVKAIAKMVRNAETREGAVSILKDIMRKGPLDNKNDETLKPVLSGKSIGKMTSGKAIGKSISPEAHWKATANIDQLFKNAIEPWQFDLDPAKNNQGIKERKVLYSPMEHGDKTVPVKLTVKQYEDEKKGSRLYSSEVIDHALKEKNGNAGQLKDGVIGNPTALSLPAWRSLDSTIPHSYPDVNNKGDGEFHRQYPMSRV